jgi:pyruvate,orthophosphate dikinase
VILPLSPGVTATADVIGAKAHGLILLRRLGLPVPPGFVVGTPACRAFLRHGRLPAGLHRELASAVAALRVPAVSVRSGAAVSMPGMMNTILDVEPAQVRPAVEAVFGSWHTPRARTYRELHDIPHDLGTAVTVQAMVYGDRDDHSGAGVAFSHDPNTGEPEPYGEVLFGHSGADVVGGRMVTRPLHELAREPAVWSDLRSALATIEAHFRGGCSVEFTFESGRLWLLQVRPVPRVVPEDVDLLDTTGADVLTRGLGACPGVATGRVATTADAAVRMAPAGPVILVRPHTSPLDMHGLAAAQGIVTATGGPASHAAVVARSLGKPAVVSATGLSVDGTVLTVGDRRLAEGTIVTIDGSSGVVVVGRAGTRVRAT